MTPEKSSRLIAAFNDFMEEAERIATEHGFTDNTPGEDIALMHSELSEALEDFRAGKSMAEIYYEAKADGAKPCGIPAELADCVIRIAHFSKRHNIALGSAIVEKMKYNEGRPFKHGNKKI